LQRLTVQTWGRNERPQNYHEYAGTVWRRLLGEEPEMHPEAFQEFENTMILGLHEMETRQFVFPEVQHALPELIEQYKDRVQKIVLWSTGDVSSTGYQIAKIDRSRIIWDFYNGLRDAFSKKEAQQFMREKTAYLVDDDKFSRFVAYIKTYLTKQTSGKIKIAIVEDNLKNIQRVQEAVQNELGDRDATRIEIVPVWAAYSRYGRIGAEKAAELGKTKKFFEKKKTFNAIDAFRELADKKFQAKLDDAHVFVDFDGVILDPDAQGKAQAEVVFGALAAAATMLHVDEEALHARMQR